MVQRIFEFRIEGLHILSKGHETCLTIRVPVEVPISVPTT